MDFFYLISLTGSCIWDETALIRVSSKDTIEREFYTDICINDKIINIDMTTPNNYIYQHT